MTSPESLVVYTSDVYKIYEPRRGLKINCDVVRQRHCFPRDHNFVRLFGYVYRRDTVLQNASTRSGAFNLFKFHLQPFTTLSSSAGTSYDSHHTAEKSAEDVVFFLDFLHQELVCEKRACEEEILDYVLVELSRCLQFAGRCSECVLTVDVRSFHLLLKLWETVWRIGSAVGHLLVNTGLSGSLSSYAPVLGRLLFWDLLSSMQQLNRASCICLQDTLVDVAQSRIAVLWEDLSKAQDEVVSLGDQEWSTLPSGSKEVLPSILQLELVSLLLQKGVQVPSNPSYCRLLLLSDLTQHPEETVSVAKILTSFWPQNATEFAMPILDFFLANMDECYDKPSLPTTGSIGQFVENEISPRSLVSACDAICSPDIKQRNAYHGCLSICAGALRGASQHGNPLRQITGRVYLKLSRSRVLTFGNSGLTNFTVMMLVFARYSADDSSSKNNNITDIMKRFQERVVPPADLPLTSARVRLIVACLSSFELLVNLLRRPVNLAPIFTFTVNRLSQETTKVHSSDVIPPLLEVLEDLVTANAFNHGLVLHPEIRILYNKCAPSLQVSILSTCSYMAERFYKHNLQSDSNTDVRESQDHFLSSIVSVMLPMAMVNLSRMEKFSSGHEINCAADLCADILVAIIKWRYPLPGSIAISPIVQELIRHVDRQPVFVARVLASLVDKSDRETFVKVWHELDGPSLLLKLVMYIRCPSPEMDKVMRIVLEISKSELFRVEHPGPNFLSCYQQLVSSWSQHHQELMQASCIAEAAAFRKTVRALLNVVQFDAKSVADLPKAQIAHLYQVVAVLFTDAPDLLYTRGLADCPLPRLLETFVYPKAQLREGKTALPKMHIECMRTQGHRFLFGLVQLLRDNDSLIRRRLAEIVTYYCKIFPEATPISMFLIMTKESPKLTKVMLDTLWSMDIDRSAVIDILLEVIKKCSETFSSAKHITNVHLTLLTKLASICGAIHLVKFRMLLEVCLLPCGVHCTSDQIRDIGPLMAGSLSKMDAARCLPLLDLVTSTWPELANHIVQDNRIQSAFSSEENRKALDQIKEKIRLVGVK
ncbi:hypothetical protein BIW11_08334 [Tropilaelaps mercedesae]|uniref:Protein MMS22-like n=1 Tax=Tropilaelaps mercedesae TaxID=418985 RepID=A0A1V9XQ01_9ACAR|nr:hypothetical protein BIW11_08334 [Tropilaelaps mercedesae]